MSTRSKVGTLIIVAVYAVVMVWTSTSFKILDDESTIVAVAGHPLLPTIKSFLSGVGQHEHPPFSDVLLHLLLQLTNYSFFSLRIFTNVFYIGAILLIASSAAKLSRTRGYWTSLLLGLALEARLRQRCVVSGEYRAAPDPSLELKKRFTNNIPTLTYRVDVTWFDCTKQGG